MPEKSSQPTRSVLAASAAAISLAFAAAQTLPAAAASDASIHPFSTMRPTRRLRI
jgi:hypothetical protein